MSAPRFYCPSPPPADHSYELPPDAAHHASRVLRLREDDAVQLFDGAGHAWDAAISKISGKHVTLKHLRPCPAETATPLQITLAQAMCSSEKMDWVVQKATELGASEIQPVQTQRSVAKLTGERIERRIAHWESVSISACEQCGRNTLPQIHAPLEFAAWLSKLHNQPGSKFVLLPQGNTALHEQPKPQQVTLLIGPEGGFTEQEALLSIQAGFVPVRMGNRILRTETAAIAGIAAMQTLWGDFS